MITSGHFSSLELNLSQPINQANFIKQIKVDISGKGATTQDPNGTIRNRERS